MLMFIFQEPINCDTPPPSNPSQNNNNVAPDKTLAAPRSVPMEIV